MLDGDFTFNNDPPFSQSSSPEDDSPTDASLQQIESQQTKEKSTDNDNIENQKDNLNKHQNLNPDSSHQF